MEHLAHPTPSPARPFFPPPPVCPGDDGTPISRTGLAKYEAAFDAFLAKMENAIRGERARQKAAAAPPTKQATFAELF